MITVPSDTHQYTLSPFCSDHMHTPLSYVSRDGILQPFVSQQFSLVIITSNSQTFNMTVFGNILILQSFSIAEGL